MKLSIRTTRELTISAEEFQKICEYVKERSGTITNSFTGMYTEPSTDKFIRELTNYLFTGEHE